MKTLSNSTLEPPARWGDAGISLILVMLAMLVLSVLAATIVFTARSETFASHSYELDTQADYVAKAGIETAINWFRSNHYAAVPNSSANADYSVTSDGSSYNLYTSNSSPVQCKANCASLNGTVQLIGYGSGSSNYPSGVTNNSGTAVATAFSNELNGGGNGVRVTGDSSHSGLFWVNAYLLNYQTVNSSSLTTCPSTTAAPPCPVETWLISATGVWTGGSSQSSAVATSEEQVTIQAVYSAS